MVLTRRLCFLAVLAAGCITPNSPRKATVSTNVALSLVHQSQITGWSSTVPDRFSARQTEELSRRNLVAVPVELAQNAAAAQLTRARLAAMTAKTKAKIVVLVESASRYDSQIVGRYRWTVFAKITVADASNLDRATSRSIDVPITLEYDHQRDAEALTQAAGPIARELGVVVDSYLASYGEITAAEGRASNAEIPDYDAIYFVMVDRFANGNPANDGDDADPSDPAGWHGGDLAGLTANLDAIANLGIRTLWLSPISATRAAKFHGHGAFHGYWTTDLGEIEPRFGSWADLESLGREARQRDISLNLDLVLNHVGPETPLASAKPEWFHKDGPITDWSDPTQLVRGEVHGLPDLDQSNPEVYRYLLDASKKWAAVDGVSGFRLDAVRHIAPAFWRRFLADARELGPLTLLGEVFDGNPAAIAEGFALGFDRLFDFPLHYAALDSLCGDNPYRDLAGALGADRAYNDPNALVTFADNHDLPRATSRCEADDLERLFFFLLSVRGVPAITWGTEVGLEGAKEPENRGDMKFGGLNRTGELIRDRLAARRDHPALRGGDRIILVADDDVLMWQQRAGTEIALLAISRSSASRRVAATTLAIDSGFRRCGDDCLELEPGAMALAWLAKPIADEAVRRVEFKATTSQPGELIVVGNIPELGLWEAKRAPVADGLVLELPVGASFSYKLANRRVSGVDFESGANRVLVVAAGDGPQREELTWRK